MRKKLFNTILAVGTALALGACGEFFEAGEALVPSTMKLDTHDVTLMVGDSCVIHPLFSPDSISNNTVFWTTTDQQVARFAGADTLVATGAGTTQAIAIAVIDYRQADTCRVNVLPRWQLTACEDYPYDMVVYADVRIHGRPADESVLIGAFCDEELRGLGELRLEHGISYMRIRIWSPFALDERVVFRCYDRRRHTLETFAETLVFDGEAHGSLSSLFLLEL